MRRLSWRHLIWAWVALIAWDAIWIALDQPWWLKLLMLALLVFAVRGLIEAVRWDERERNKPRTFIIAQGVTIEADLTPAEARQFIAGWRGDD
jgi:CDP-diglyceride synthetase